MPSTFQSSKALTSLLLAGFALALTSLAQTNAEPRILFLHVQLTKEKSIKLIEATARPGELKPQPQAHQPDGIHFDLLSADGKLLWQGATPDLTQRIVEYDDPTQPGKRKPKRIEKSEAEFTVRVPALTNGHHIAFYTLSAVGTNDWGQTNQLGTLNLPTK